jgi:hypothetical protein
MSKEVATISPSSERAITQSAPQSYTFEQIGKMAVAFAKSGLFGVKDQDQALALMLYAQASGRHPALIMRDYDIIQNRLAKKAEAMLRDFQSSGGKVEWKEYTDQRVVGVFSHPLSPAPISIDWDMARAEKAGLAGKSGDMYKKFTRAMFRSRCISEGVRTCAPDATEQMYTPEEIRTIEQEQTVVSIDTAASEAAKQITHALSQDEVDSLVMTMDVKTIPELTVAFGKAYTRAKEAGDDAAKARLKSVYHQTKADLELGAI